MIRTALVVVALVIAAGCSGDDGRTTAQDPAAGRSTTSAPLTATTAGGPGTNAGRTHEIELKEAGTGGPGFPALVLAHDHSVEVVREGAIEEVATVDVEAWLGIEDGAGGFIVERRIEEGRSELLAVTPEGAQPIPTDHGPAIFLQDVVVVGETPHVIYVTLDEQTTEEVRGYVVLQNLASGASTRLAEAFLPEHGVKRVSAGGEIVVASAFADLTETFEFFTLDGARVPDAPNPTSGLEYNAPPLMAHAVLSPDGSQLAHLEGPDWDGYRQVEVGQWVLVVSNRPAGDERLRVRVGDKDVQVVWMDFDGRWAVISRQTDDGQLLSPIIVDTHANPPVGHVLSGLVGNATLATQR